MHLFVTGWSGVGAATLINQTAAIIGRRDHRPTLAAIACPTLVIVGEHDRVTPVDCSREIADGIEGVELMVVPGVGHCSPFEAPEIVNARLAEFLK